MAEHRCRLTQPSGYSSYRRVNCQQKSGGKCIDVIFGVKGTGANRKTEIQALRYPAGTWSAEAAKSHCSGRGGAFTAGAQKDDILEVTMEELERHVKNEPDDPHGTPVALENESIILGRGYPEVPEMELPERLKPRHQQDPNAELEERLRQP